MHSTRAQSLLPKKPRCPCLPALALLHSLPFNAFNCGLKLRCFLWGEHRECDENLDGFLGIRRERNEVEIPFDCFCEGEDSLLDLRDEYLKVRMEWKVRTIGSGICCRLRVGFGKQSLEETIADTQIIPTSIGKCRLQGFDCFLQAFHSDKSPAKEIPCSR